MLKLIFLVLGLQKRMAILLMVCEENRCLVNKIDKRHLREGERQMDKRRLSIQSHYRAILTARFSRITVTRI